MFTLRGYQQEAVDATINWCKKSVDPCLIVAPTGAGKSIIIAKIADVLYRASGGKRVLVTAPSSELVVQDHEKYGLTGARASIYSASAGSKCLRHSVVFGTPGTIKNNLHRFGNDYAAIVIDEAHGLSPTLLTIIDGLRERNPNIRVIGLTATPYRLGRGYIYRVDSKDRALSDTVAKDPFFTKCVYEIDARMLIESGYLTAPLIGKTDADGYDTSGLTLQKNGKFKQSDIDVAFCGHGRKTSAIVADVVSKGRDRHGVMLFCATIEHAKEALASLPPSLSAIVTGETKTSERKRILRDFKAQKIKYLVNVSVLTTGFDAAHVDVIALLRATESVSLLQQIIGRGLRILNGKKDCLVLDYAGNVEKHCPDNDIFKPEIKAAFKGEDKGVIEVTCPECGQVNLFSPRPNDEGFLIDAHGYFTDLAGNHIETEFGPMPAHYGRRCKGIIRTKRGHHLHCGHRWTFKVCEACGHENDIAARRCANCREEIIDPAEKLRIDFAAFKKDPTVPQCDEVLKMQAKSTLTRKGDEALMVEFLTPYRSFSVWYFPTRSDAWSSKNYARFISATENMTTTPATVKYMKDGDFYKVLTFGEPADEISKMA